MVFTALVAARATRSFCSAPKPLNAGHEFDMNSTHSTLYCEHGKSVLLQRSGKRDFLVIRVVKTSEVNSVDMSTTKRGDETLKCEIRSLRTGHPSTRG